MTMEATITIEGKELTVGQSMALRVAVTSFLFQLQDKTFTDGLGPIAIGYHDRLEEVLLMISEGCGP